MSDLNYIAQIGKELNAKFKPTEEINWYSRFTYTLNKDGYVSGLGLYNCVRNPDRIAFVLKEFTELSVCNLSATTFSDYSFLKDLVRLTTIYLRDTPLSDYSFLKDLIQLQTLDLSCDTHHLIGGPSIDISFLKNLVQLQTLDFSYGQINDISVLKDLVQLQTLALRNTQISDISVLKDLVRLHTLDLSNTQINDISVLKDLVQLQTLALRNTQISDISVLKDLVQLHTLDLSGTQLSDYSCLKNLVQLHALDLSGAQLSDISFLKDLIQLHTLDLTGAQLSDYSVLKDLVQLHTLDLSGAQLSDISALKDLVQIHALYLNHTQLSDISALKDLVRLQSLELNGNQLSDCSVLKDLIQLQKLNLGRNQLSDISFLKDLVQLHKLDIGANRISDISVLKDLVQLRYLDLGINQLSDISALKNLVQLHYLDLSFTQLSDISFLKNLVKLRALNLSDNQISDISILKSFAHLRFLNLENNNIKELPFWIDGLGLEISYGSVFNKDLLNLGSNPLEAPPVEIVMQGTEAVRNYFDSLRDKKNVKLNEVKVLFVGEGMTGKTSLLKRLQDLKFDVNESQTHGINVVSLKTDKIKGLAQNETLKNFWLNCWDFGGQEIMHASHRFFMSQRALYILVLDSRTDSKKYYWLKHIQKYGGDSPLIVVMNKIDANPNYNIEQKNINDNFPQIKNRFHRTSCKNGQGIPALLECIAKTIPDTSLFGTYISTDWMRIKEKLVSETKKYHYIDRDRFLEICEENGVQDESIKKTVLKYLHDIGIVLHFEKLDLADIYVLDPHWVTIGVYKIINSNKIEKGILNEKDLDYILNQENIKSDEYDPAKEKTIIYSPQEQRYIVNIMMQFELCYQYDRGKGEYVIPDLLPKELSDEPALTGSNPLNFIMQYDYLPPSIISRLMLRFRNDIPSGKHWKYGMILQNVKFECQAKVKADEDKKAIAITIQGEFLRKREYFSVIRHNINDISSEFENLKIDEFIPLPGYPNYLVKYRQLLGYEKAGRDEYFDGELGKNFSVSEMLDSVISKADRTREKPMPNIKIKLENIGNPEQHANLKAKLTATLQQTVTQEVKNVQGLFKNLKEDILGEIDIEIADEKEKRRIQNELQKTENALKELESAAIENRKELDEGTKNRIEEFIDNLSDENSRLNKAIKLLSNGAKKVQKLGRTYNKLASYFGIPNVPPVLLGDGD